MGLQGSERRGQACTFRLSRLDTASLASPVSSLEIHRFPSGSLQVERSLRKGSDLTRDLARTGYYNGKDRSREGEREMPTSREPGREKTVIFTVRLGC